MPKCLTTEEFIVNAKKKHGERYDYSRSVYVDYKTKVVITCREHGDFRQIAETHISGKGCKKCASELTALKNKLTKEEFIERSISMHGHRYDYSMVNYKSIKSPVLIICSQHGEFYQSPDAHVRGSGCTKCTSYGIREAYVYIMEMDGLIKVGVSNNPELRLKRVGKSLTSSVVLISKFYFKSWVDAQKAEKKAHILMKERNAGLTGFDGATEFFNVPISEAADLIKKLGGKQ